MSTDDESFHPLGNEWEGELEEMLDDTEYDSDLGMKMAQDAMRVTKGELSEAEFHEMYHDDVMEEFGVDDRPTEAAYEQAQEEQKGTATRMLEAFEGDGEESRRETMKKMGVGAAAVGLGAWGTVDDGPEANLAAADDHSSYGKVENDGTQLGMVIDLERCDGCLSCVAACQEENQTDQGVNWMYVLDYEEPDGDNSGSRNRLVRPCQHCTDAPCEKVCPTTARHTRDKDGLVLTDYDVCIGCRYCQVACPYGVNYFQWDEPSVSTDEIKQTADDMGMDGDHMTDHRDRWVDSRAPRGVMSKCTMCPTRQDGHMGDEKVGTTACEDACPPEAINFGDMNDPESKPQQYLTNVVQTRAERMVDGQSPNRENVQESYNFLEGDVELLEMEYLEDGDHDEIQAALFIQGELAESELTLEDEELREVVIDIIGDADALAELEDEELGTLADVLLGDASEGDVDSDDLDAANTAIDAVITDAEEGVQAVVDRYESREITPAEVEESLALLDGEEEPWVSEAGITDEGSAQNVLEAYAGGEASTFKLLEDVGTNPNVTYIGNEPGPEAEQVEGPVAYSDIGGTDNRKDVLDEKTVGDAGVSL
ncbi:4Fe-4S ferredoxin N-terminal domain-containing protein [Natronorubrum thiooxidans]|uniref:Prokaryotic molybdopterin-containing oxidoreductase family, iron-sulfur binding subunit n=1 Tax=Natronorubrum thiooxidans TaxID=308853 RepID=A0A1N7E5H7_9EURY|nr:4Fe-4S ferredoxin N-terminal domain-containing protein [Natronorubrum thiooxidans]SIR83357.1 prokaryotic molybdopterin-containing oxidoreductase family, iron-sulfur binding subunit [Natronorubrum thiooxidans]